VIIIHQIHHSRLLQFPKELFSIPLKRSAAPPGIRSFPGSCFIPEPFSSSFYL